jgi:large subunit ribosomal protein L5
MSRLKEKYNKEIISSLKKDLGFKNDFQTPRLTKVVINTGIGRFLKESSLVDAIEKDITAIAGQKAVRTKAKKSLAAFKIREGMDVGVKVTLRGGKMYDFIDRLISISFPRTRDFKGLDPKNIDSNGNLNLGIREHIVFPEINPENARGIFGLQITVTTTAKDKESAEKLFRSLGFPLKKT